MVWLGVGIWGVARCGYMGCGYRGWLTETLCGSWCTVSGRGWSGMKSWRTSVSSPD